VESISSPAPSSHLWRGDRIAIGALASAQTEESCGSRALAVGSSRERSPIPVDVSHDYDSGAGLGRSGAGGPGRHYRDRDRAHCDDHVLPRTSFMPRSRGSRAGVSGAPVGIALAAGTFPSGSELATTLYAAGGAEPLMTPDSGVFVARVVAGGAGAIESWRRQRVLPAPRAFAAAAVATPYNSRFAGSAMYVIGGIDLSGVAQATVLGANVTPDSVSARFVFLEPLPAPRAGAIAAVRRGRIYVIGGVDASGTPQSTVFMGRIGLDGHIDGWYSAPSLPGARAYGGGLARDAWVAAIGGVADSVPLGGGTDAGIARLVTGDTAAVSLQSGFFTGVWGLPATCYRRTLTVCVARPRPYGSDSRWDVCRGIQQYGRDARGAGHRRFGGAICRAGGDEHHRWTDVLVDTRRDAGRPGRSLLAGGYRDRAGAGDRWSRFSHPDAPQLRMGFLNERPIIKVECR
jgi:hypothetical protein